MFFELIATFAAGFMAAGLALIANRLSGGRLPKWSLPVAAGTAMIAFAIWSEYSWYGRSVASLPERFEVTLAVESSAVWRPWTYVAPLTVRFAAVDGASLRTHPGAPEHRVVNMVYFARWAAPRQVPVAFDCAAGARALLAGDVTLAQDGRIEGAEWVTLPPDDPALVTVCTGLAAPA